MQKHGVGLGEASSVLGDTLSITIPDPDHSDDDEGWVTIDRSHRRRLLVCAADTVDASLHQACG